MNIVKRVFHKINIHAQANARWSYVDPPLATLPPDLRDIYEPDKGWPWIGWDYEMQELRIIAALSKDKPMLDTFTMGWDIHTMNCCDIFGWPYPSNRKNPHTSVDDRAWREQIAWQGKDDERRVFAKRFVYRLNYGGDPKTMGSTPGAKALGLDGKKLVRLANQYMAAHPQLNHWRRTIQEEAARTGMTRTFTGRRRCYLSGGKNRDRQALDHPMQAAGQDIANLTIVEVKDTYKDDVYYVYGMHDSQWWAIREAKWDVIVPGIKRIATQPRWINGMDVPFPAAFKERRL